MTIEVDAMKLSHRAVCVPVFLTLLIVLTWLVCLPSKQMAYFLQREVWPDSNDTISTDDWISQFQHFVENTALRDDMYKPNKTDNIICGKFPESFQENLDVVMNYPFNISEEFLKKLHLDTDGIQKLSEKTAESSVPVLAMASSANHFSEAQTLIKDIHQKVMPKFKNIKLVFYDIGLKPSQQKLLKKHCRCEVRTFSFDEYPDHVRKLLGYTWKPIIIQSLLQEFDFVMWMDASVRFHGTALKPLFSEASQTGVKVVPGGGSIAIRTHSNTFKALKEQPCMFHWPELEATWMLVKRTKFTLQGVMKPWVSCALQYECMAQPRPNAMLTCPWGRNKKFGSCHRFDQSVLGIILTRLFNYKVQLAHFKVSDYGTIKREDRSNYLEHLDSHS